MCQGGLNGVSRVFQGIFQEVSNFKSVLNSFEGIPRKFLWYFKEVSGVFQVRGKFLSTSLKWVSRIYERSSKSVSV